MPLNAYWTVSYEGESGLKWEDRALIIYPRQEGVVRIYFIIDYHSRDMWQFL
jgi:hypothetical protein